MKRLSNITESIWSDIQKRSSGETIRKEDEVDNLDRDGFYDYLLNHYDIKVSSFKPINDEVMDRISIPLSYDVLVRMITFDFKHNIIYVPMGTLYYKDLLLNTARNFFVTADSDDNPVNYIINPKDKSKPTNTFFLNVLDFLIKEINDKTLLIHKSVNESIWSDIQKRSSGETIRKEDTRNSNVKDMKPVDLELSVLWADKDLEIDDENEFTIDKIADYAPDGWRRPTQKEVDELLHNTKKTVDQDLSPKTFKRIFKLSNNGVDIYFSCKNLKEKAEYWELDKGDMDEYWNTFVLEESGSFVAHSAYQIGKLNEKHRVRFVKER